MSPFLPPVPSNYTPLITGVNVRWNQFYADAPPTWFESVAQTTPSSNRFEHYNWAKSVPSMKEWIGPLSFDSLASYQYILENKDWVEAIALRKPDVDDNNFSNFWNQLNGLAQSAKKLPDQLMANALINGQSALGWDGQYFFSSTHPISYFSGGVSGTQQNYWSSGTALTFDNLSLVYNTMTTYRNDENRPLGIMPDTIVVPPQLQILANRLVAPIVADQTVTGLTMAGNQPNALPKFKVVVAPELSAYSTTWYLLDMSKVVKPFIWQNRQDTVFTSKVSDTDQNVFVNNELWFKAYRRGNAGYGLWYCAAKAVG